MSKLLLYIFALFACLHSSYATTLSPTGSPTPSPSVAPTPAPAPCVNVTCTKCKSAAEQLEEFERIINDNVIDFLDFQFDVEGTTFGDWVWVSLALGLFVPPGLLILMFAWRSQRGISSYDGMTEAMSYRKMWIIFGGWVFLWLSFPMYILWNRSFTLVSFNFIIIWLIHIWGLSSVLSVFRGDAGSTTLSKRWTKMDSGNHAAVVQSFADANGDISLNFNIADGKGSLSVPAIQHGQIRRSAETFYASGGDDQAIREKLSHHLHGHWRGLPAYDQCCNHYASSLTSNPVVVGSETARPAFV